MSLHSYHFSRKLLQDDPPFYSLIMAAIWKADTDNLAKLKTAWPDVVSELNERYHSPLGMGILESDKVENRAFLKEQLKGMGLL